MSEDEEIDAKLKKLQDELAALRTEGDARDAAYQAHFVPVMFGTGAPEPLETRDAVLNRLCNVWQTIQGGVDNDEVEAVDFDLVMNDITRVADFLQKEWGIDFWAGKPQK
jgi:hypothetical protein